MANPDKILIVDDDPEMCELLSLSLSPLGYEIASANDGFQALERIEAERFGVVILDIALPDLDGVEILRRIRERRFEVEVIVLTAYASLETAIGALRMGAYDYITKPFRIGDVRSTVKRAVEKQRLETRLAAVHDLSREMTLLPDVGQVAEMVLDVTERVLEFKICALWLVDEEQDILYRLAARGAEREVGEGDPEESYRLPLSSVKRVTVAAARSGELLYVPDTREEPRYVTRGTANRSELAVPLKVNGRVIGVLNVESTGIDAFTPDDVRLLSTLAAQASVAIRNSHLYEQAQQEIAEHKRAEEKIEQRTRELQALNEIGQVITSTLDLQKALTLIADQTIQLMDAAAASVLLYDEDNDDLWFAAGSGLDTGFILGKRLALGQGISGWVAQHGEPLLVPDVSRDPRWFSGFDAESGFATHSILCVPLQSKGQIIGALAAINKENGPFNQADLWLLTALAAPAATAIENARLFEQVRTGRAQLRALSRRLVETQEAERGRIARELHDETGQTLSSLLLGMSLLEREADDPAAVIARVNELESMVDGMLENLHRLAVNLRPATLDHLGLVPALEHYIEPFGQQHGITVQFGTVGLGDERLPPAVETAIYRIVQEALTNVVRHARATRVDVLLERRGDQVVTIVEDDGAGFDPEDATQSNRLGLFGMRERAEMLGGALVIESSAGTGTTVLVEIPCVHPGQEA